MNALYRRQPPPHIHICIDPHPTKEATIPVKDLLFADVLGKEATEKLVSHTSWKFPQISVLSTACKPDTQFLCMQICCSEVVFLSAFCSFSISVEERGNVYTEELSELSMLLSGLQKTKLKAVIWCNLVIAPNRGTYNLIFLSSDAH